MKEIKINILYTLVAFVASIGFISSVNAASATISVRSDLNTVTVGNNVKVTVTVSSSAALGSWEYGLDYDINYFSLVSGSTKVADYATNGSTKSKTYTYTFKAKKSGSALFKINSPEIYGWDENKMTANTSSKSIAIKTQAEIEASYSKNNNLSSLTIDGVDLSPVFDKDTLEYSVEFPPETKEVNITAKVADSKASVSGAGTITLTEGANQIMITVTAQNGNEKKYTINATVKELSPIVVTVNDETLNIIRKDDALTKPTTYTETTVTILGEEIPAFNSEITGYTLVGLKDSAGKIKLYIYDSNTEKYELYQELTLKGMIFSSLKTDEVPDRYTKGTITINGIETVCYKLNDSSEFILVYGINVENGNEGFYVYDKKENTLQRYNKDEINILADKTSDYLFVASVFGGGLLLAIFLIIAMIVNKNKRKNKLKSLTKQEQTKEVKNN